MPTSSTREPSSGLRTRSGANLGLKPHQHLAAADRTIRDLRVQLADAKRELKTSADDLERATTEALRMQAELVALKKEIDDSRERESESARQWIAMSAELGAARARLDRYTRVLKRIREHAAEGELREVVSIVDLHTPDESEQ